MEVGQAYATQCLPLADAPDAYQRFDRREDGYIKIVLDPARTST
jgi:glutathione-independent formaldehyde dehydrogenase